MKAQGATLAGSVVSGVLASACCMGPLVLSLLGVSGAAFAQRFEPLRPYLLVLTYGLLGGGFYLTYRPGKADCAPGEVCGMSVATAVVAAAPAGAQVETVTFATTAAHVRFL